MAYNNNRNANMRGNNRKQNAFRQQPAQTPYQGGVGRGANTAGVRPQAPITASAGETPNACPPGQIKGRDPRTGRMACIPSTQGRQQGQGGQVSGPGSPGGPKPRGPKRPPELS